MMRATGCDGVVVGRGCLGRPWLFRDLADVFEGREPGDPPVLGDVVDVMLEHAGAWRSGSGDEGAAMQAFRKHSSWYTKCFPGSAPLRQRLMRVSTLAELEAVLGEVDRALPYPPEAMRVPRGKTSGTQKVALARRLPRRPRRRHAARGSSPRPPTPGGRRRSGSGTSGVLGRARGAGASPTQSQEPVLLPGPLELEVVLARLDEEGAARRVSRHSAASAHLLRCPGPVSRCPARSRPPLGRRLTL